MPRLLTKLIFSVLIVVMVVAGFAVKSLCDFLNTPMNIPESGFAYLLPKGGSLSQVGVDLSLSGVLENRRWLSAYSRISGRGAEIEAGEYWLESGLTPLAMITKLEQGDVRFFELALIEGWNMRQVLSRLQSAEGLIKTLPADVVELTADMLGLKKRFPSLEGLLYPDTYRYHSGTTDKELLLQAYQRMQEVLDREWVDRSKNLPYENAYQALTMASLIERETGVARERTEISGVFVRRLRQGMRLQTDPAVIYGLGISYTGNLRSRHLKDASNRFNTYRHHGLTPTPIALAGREAIYAALHPADGKSLYFVAKGDGTHYFSETLEEHQKAVRKYQIEHRRKDYSSTPAANPAG
ncbi:MAG: endolytic transglycosylase MltG [Oceanicoccus sp.]